MTANMYDQPALALFINTYTPINFGELYRIGAALKQAVEEASQLLSTLLQKWGEFRSPSAVDTQKYYDITVNRPEMQKVINTMVTNPDAMKDAATRAELQGILNNVDYGTLSKLKQSSENLDARQKIIAQMKAQGKYNAEWDDLDINNWDTSKAGIMTELSPIEYMTANQLSNAYFDNLKPSTLLSVFKNGVKYQREGITGDMLQSIAEAKFNDLINTPQGMKYYLLAVRNAGGDEDAAKQAFTRMIASSQMDRITVNESVDPYWLATARHDASGKNEEIVKPNPTRLDFLNDTTYKNIMDNIGSRLSSYRNYIAGLIDKYPNTKISEDAKKGLLYIDKMLNQYVEMIDTANLYGKRYQATGDSLDLVNATIASSISEQLKGKLNGLAEKHILRQEFQRVAGFTPVAKTNEYSSLKYVKGINAALDLIKSPIALMKGDDLLTGIGGNFHTIVDENGTVKDSYLFSSSEGFVLPETIFSMAAEVKPRDVTRPDMLFTKSQFQLKELIEGGRISDVQFIPENKKVKIGGNFALSGKMRIPKDQIYKALGKGWISFNDKNTAANAAVFGITGGLGSAFTTSVMGAFGKKSTKNMIEDAFGGRKVTEKIGDDGVLFFEIEVYKVLPKENTSSEYWQRVNQKWQGGSDTGIGGSSQAKEEYGTSAKRLM